jgi:N-acetylglucosamine-6-sulfatase
LAGSRSAILVAVMVGVAAALAGCGSGPGQRPSIVLIQTDDQVLSDLDATFRTGSGNEIPVLGNTRRLMIDTGVTFNRYYVSVPVCCPSRAALLTGRYARNNGVLTNTGETGGYAAFARHDMKTNLAVWLQRAGYRTIHVGKFLNGYSSSPPKVPPGWDDWLTLADDPATSLYYGYRFNLNGQLSGRFGDPTYEFIDSPGCPHHSPARCDYVTDVLTAKALRAMRSVPAGRPFYVQLDYTAPHTDDHGPIGPPPPPRYNRSLAGIKAPRGPNFDEADVSDKPAFVRRRPPLSANDISRVDARYERRLESERAVDDGVAAVVRSLERLGRMSNTYVFLVSDNGFFLGEHRFSTGKFLPYEPSSHMPLVVRGPGVPEGGESEALIANVDVAPTMLQISGASGRGPVDGRSLLRFAEDPELRSRRPILLEDFTRGGSDEGAGPADGASSRVPHAYAGIRAGPYKYIRYGSGETELYDLERDPYELRSLAASERYRQVVSWLDRHLDALLRCKGASCRRPVGPIPRPRP